MWSSTLLLIVKKPNKLSLVGSSQTELLLQHITIQNDITEESFEQILTHSNVNLSLLYYIFTSIFVLNMTVIQLLMLDTF